MRFVPRRRICWVKVDVCCELPRVVLTPRTFQVNAGDPTTMQIAVTTAPKSLPYRLLTRQHCIERGCRGGDEVGHEIRAGPQTGLADVWPGVLQNRYSPQPQGCVRSQILWERC